MSGPRRRLAVTSPQWAISIGLALAVIGFAGAIQWNSSVARERFTSSAQQVLTDQVVALEREQNELRAQIAEAEAEVRAAQESGTGAAVEAVSQQVAEIRAVIGQAELRGPGVVVEIADSKRVVPPGENPANYLVLVDDLRDIVAALWASGAEAITINDERLVASTSIYGAGAAILVNTARLSPPFRIEAIGADGLHERFLNHPAFLGRAAQRIDAFGLEFATEPNGDLLLDAFVGTTRLRWAVPVEEPT